jgi:hypothetical protein
MMGQFPTANNLLRNNETDRLININRGTAWSIKKHSFGQANGST